MLKRIITGFLALLLAVISVGTVALGETDDGSVSYEFVQEEQAAPAVPEIGSACVILGDSETGKIIYESNAHEKMYPASTTKILTALLVLENCKLEETATVSEGAVYSVPYNYSNAGLVPGEELTVYTLMQAMLIYSANEAATVLAEHISGSVEAFAELCNQRAAELGCENLHFVNANGMHDDNHYCTAYDLFVIARECQKYPVFNEIVQTQSFTIPATALYSQEDRFCRNTNKMLLPSYKRYYYPYCTGIKTGYTTPAGHCLVSSAMKDGMNLICVVLGGAFDEQGNNERYTDSATLYDFAFENYSIETVCAAGQTVGNIKVKNATRDTAVLDAVVETELSGIAPNGFDMAAVEPTVTFNDEIKAPVSKGQVIGQATFAVDGVHYTADIVAANDVEKSNAAIGFIIILLFALAAAIAFAVKRFKSGKKAAVRAE